MSEEQMEITEAQQEEILRRLRETDTHPQTLEPFDESDLERMLILAATSHGANAR